MPETIAGLSDDARAHVRDTHFVPKLTVSDQSDLGTSLGAEPAQKRNQKLARNALVVHLFIVSRADQEQWTAYPRDRNALAAFRYYFGREFSYTAILWAIKTLEAAGLIEHRKAKPGFRPSAEGDGGVAIGTRKPKWHQRFRSTVRATEKLRLSSEVILAETLIVIVGKLIRLRDEDRQLVRYRDNNKTRWLRSDVELQNVALQELNITLQSPNWAKDELGFYRNGNRLLYSASKQLYRVFNGGWEFGGRWYGGWWQSLPSADRARLQINGSPVVEIDYHHLHPTLLAAGIGIEWGDVDPYTIADWPRTDIKLAFNILLNAGSMTAAVGAVQEKFRERGYQHPRKRASSAIEAVKAAHPQFEGLWGTGIGLRLQCIDGMMCAEVQRRMRSHGYTALSVHDSFIVEEPAREILQGVMEKVLQETKKTLSEHGLQNSASLLGSQSGEPVQLFLI